jgi:hypothetical protein
MTTIDDTTADELFSAAKEYEYSREEWRKAQKEQEIAEKTLEAKRGITANRFNAYEKAKAKFLGKTQR